ncbi:MAG: cytochrome c [Akkermansiaceae bacterium]|nr:cytochrome c [Akkermansiaceae bacterium]
MSEKNLDYEAEGASVVKLHDSVRRERILPPSGREPLSFGPLILGAFVLLLGAGFLGAYGNGFKDDIFITSYYRPEPRPAGAGGDTAAAQLTYIDKVMKDGKRVYGNCVPCHQPTGLGNPGQFPPLKGSEWTAGGTHRFAAILLKGINGSLKVSGQTYTLPMPPWGTLSDQDLAAVITYVRHEFAGIEEPGIVTPEMVKAAREEFSGQAVPWTEAELLAIPKDEMLPGAQVDPVTGEPAGEKAEAPAQ